MNYSPKKMSELLINNNFNFKKKYGQNFIVDENIIKNIINLSNIDKDTLVIEIGPGAGSLTYFLAKYSKEVICYEVDTTLENILKNNLSEYSNINIIFGDFLKQNMNEEIKKHDFKKLYVVANLPYNITTPIIVKIIEDKINVDKLVIMVQKEVGDRFKAKPNTKEYNSLSIYLNYYFDIKKILDVSKNVFMPKPNVDSIVLELDRKKEYLKINEEIFFKLIKDAFKQKRKTLRNNLKNYDLDKINKILQEYNFSLDSRAEQIPDYVFAIISKELGGNIC